VQLSREVHQAKLDGNAGLFEDDFTDAAHQRPCADNRRSYSEMDRVQRARVSDLLNAHVRSNFTKDDSQTAAQLTEANDLRNAVAHVAGYESRISKADALLLVVIVRMHYAHPKCFTAAAVTRDFERLGHHPFDVETSFAHFPGFAFATEERREICRKAVPAAELLFDKNGGVTEKDLDELMPGIETKKRTQERAAGNLVKDESRSRGSWRFTRFNHANIRVKRTMLAMSSTLRSLLRRPRKRCPTSTRLQSCASRARSSSLTRSRRNRDRSTTTSTSTLAACVTTAAAAGGRG
jgi:hypothetical protein